ncbi:hypothetical protein KCU67_g8701, partial [Aureobasidium melanogenum]
MFWKVFAEDELDQLLVPVSANEKASTDDPFEPVSGDDSSQSDSDNPSGSESDDSSASDGDEGYIEDYNKTKQSLIFTDH